jgi:ribosomal protein S12 methylthiotransferase
VNIGFISLGCAKNRVDTEIMMALVQKSQHKLVNDLEKAELVIINTCGFINDAKEEAIDHIISTGHLKEQGKLRYIIAAGCLAQRYGRELMDEMPELDGVIGISAYHGIVDVIDQIAEGKTPALIEPAPAEFIEKGERVLSTPPGYAYLKITEGCNNRCSYCAIPIIRGQLRSNPEPEILKELESLAKKGIKELVILGQDTAVYGQDLGVSNGLPSLLKQISRIDGIEWIRLMYLHPAHINQEIIETIAADNKIFLIWTFPFSMLPLRFKKDERGPILILCILCLIS